MDDAAAPAELFVVSEGIDHRGTTPPSNRLASRLRELAGAVGRP